MTVEIELTETELEVHLTGVSGALAMKSHLTLPLADVVSAQVLTVEQAKGGEKMSAKFPGTRIPGVFWAGSFRNADSWQFWYVARAETVLVIDVDHEKYARLVLELPEPQLVADQINAARSGN
ncbi:MAG: hypothetical protein WD029_05870 [Microthrixaceae bacterium]